MMLQPTEQIAEGVFANSEGISFSFDKPSEEVGTGRKLTVPITIVTIDAFERCILTPMNKIGNATEYDHRAYFSWKFTRHYEEILDDRAYPDDVRAEMEKRTLKDRIAIRCLLAAAAYERMVEFPDIHFEKASEEILTIQDGKMEQEKAFYADLIGNEVNGYAYDFFDNYLVHVDMTDFPKIIAPLMSFYIVVTRLVAKATPRVKFHSHILQKELSPEINELIKTLIKTQMAEEVFDDKSTAKDIQLVK